MNSRISDLLGIEFPLVAFSHSRDVVVEVSKAGGMGVFGAAGCTPEQLDIELSWIADHADGKPFGLDLIIPASHESRRPGDVSAAKNQRNTTAHGQFIRDILAAHNIDASMLSDERLNRNTALSENVHDDAANRLLDVAFSHDIGLVANALGVPPPFMRDRARAKGLPTAALVGTREQAVKQAEAGVNVIVAAGTEAGGHCGDVPTMVLVPEVCEALARYPDVAVLGAGGIMTGRQMAACMAMGADGAWTGSVWLTTAEAETSAVIREKLLRAGARDTVRTRARSGKPCRLLRSAWTDAWESPLAPEALPLPIQFDLTERPLQLVLKLAEAGHPGATDLATYFVGQGVGLMNEMTTCRDVVYAFMEDFLVARERLQGAV